MVPKSEMGSAQFGDSLQFTVNVNDNVPLSTLKARLFFGEEMVSETVIRTKTNDDYTGKIYVPYYANIPNGKATLRLIMQNIHFTITEQEFEVSLTRPDFPYLTLITADKEYRMEREAINQYKLTTELPRKIKGYIQAPAVGKWGNEIDFGWVENAVKEHSTTGIPFSNSDEGVYSITFNTLTYEASPFIIAYAINDQKMDRVDDNNYKADLALTKGQDIIVEGFDGFETWWLDPNFFKKESGGQIAFTAIDGNYRIEANIQHQYLTVEVLDSSNKPASLQADGSGAIWVIGEGVGYPTTANAVGWNTSKALCMAPLGNKKYEITFVAGKTLKADNINFKFFFQKGWGSEFGSARLSTESDLVYIISATQDNGNLRLLEGKTFEENKTYAFIIDLTAGNDNAVLTLEKR